MIVQHNVTIDVVRQRKNVIRVVQEDSARQIRLTLLRDSVPYDVSEGISDPILTFVEFKKADGHGGMYDTTSLGETAVELEDQSVPNVWIVNLDGQCFTAPGWTQVNVRFETESGMRIHTFAIMVDVAPTASSDTESTDWGELNSIGDLKAAVSAMFEATMSVDAKQALLNLLAHVAYADDDGQDYYDTLEAELFRSAEIVSISAVFDQGSAIIYDTDDIDTLKQYLTVTATYEDLSTREITGYTLSGNLTAGTSTITVSYGGKTTTFTASITSYKERPFYSLSSGLLIKEIASNGNDTTHGYYIATNNRNRRFFLFGHGDESFLASPDGGSTFTPTDYYPIPVPSTATQVTISITPSTQFIGCNEVYLDPETNLYKWASGTGWNEGVRTQTLSDKTNRFLIVTSKYNSAGTSYPTEPSELTITYS